MNRYHKEVYFKHISELQEANNQLNNLEFTYSKHCLNNLRYRIIDLNKLLLFIKNIILNYNDIFEYYEENNNILKLCYRIKFNNYQDIILVLSNNKNIITIYLNNVSDKHYTLKQELYIKAV